MLKRLIETAAGEIGTAETGSNIVKYNDAYWGPSYRSNGADYPWCVVFCWWCCKAAGVAFPATAHCNGVESYAKNAGLWVTENYKQGDFVIFDYNNDGNRDHIGLVESVDGNRLTTIEGNYGDKVARVNRQAGEIIGAYRPDYGEPETEDAPEAPYEPQNESGPEGVNIPSELPILRLGDYGEAVGALQTLLRFHGYKMTGSFTRSGKPDLDFGAETAQALEDLTGYAETVPAAWKILIGGLG